MKINGYPGSKIPDNIWQKLDRTKVVLFCLKDCKWSRDSYRKYSIFDQYDDNWLLIMWNNYLSIKKKEKSNSKGTQSICDYLQQHR